MLKKAPSAMNQLHVQLRNQVEAQNRSLMQTQSGNQMQSPSGSHVGLASQGQSQSNNQFLTQFTQQAHSSFKGSL